MKKIIIIIPLFVAFFAKAQVPILIGSNTTNNGIARQELKDTALNIRNTLTVDYATKQRVADSSLVLRGLIANASSLPSQTGNDGKYLQTNSTTAVWETHNYIQTVATTGQTILTKWGGTILIPAQTGNITITLPDAVGAFSKKITVIRVGAANGFTLTINSNLTVIAKNNFAELNNINGAITFEITDNIGVDAGTIRQVSATDLIGYVNYSNANSGAMTLVSGVAQTVPLALVTNAGISMTANGFNLLAGNTYELTATIKFNNMSAGGVLNLGWQTSTFAALPNGTITFNQANDGNFPRQSYTIQYTPTANTNVIFRVNAPGSNATATIDQVNSVFSVKQISSGNQSTITNFVGSTSTTAGSAGLVPAPAAGTQYLYLKADGTYGNVSNRKTQSVATTPVTVADDEDFILLTGATAQVVNLPLNTSYPSRVLRIINGTNVVTHTTSVNYINSTGGNSNFIPAWGVVELYSFGGNWRQISVPMRTPNVQRFTASGTYTPTSGMRYAIVEMVGGGGGSGGSNGTAGFDSRTSGGGSGGYIKALLTQAQIGASQTVTIGAGGAAGAAAAGLGGNGGNTTLGTLLTANGGSGSAGANGTTAIGAVASAPGVGGAFTITTGVDLGSTPGEEGFIAYTVGNGSSTRTARGASSKLGRGALSASSVGGATTAATAATANTGGGATGSSANNITAAIAGAAGGSGLVIITEYFN